MRCLVWGSLPQPVARLIHERVRRTPSWSALYSALRTAERAHRDVSPAQLDFVESLVLADASFPARTRARRPAFAALAATAAVAVVAFVVMQGPPAEGPGDELIERGDAAGPPLVGVRLRCLDRVTQEVRASAAAGPREPSASMTCAENDLLSIAFTNVSDRRMHAIVVGVGDDGGLRWLQPFSPDATSVVLEPGVTDEPLAVAADLTTLPSEARMVVYALFGATPVTAGELAKQLQSSRNNGVLSRALTRLPVPIEHQAQVELRRAPP